MSQQTLNRLRGIDNPDRIDEALYHDYETEAERQASAGRLPVGPRSTAAASGSPVPPFEPWSPPL